MRVPGYQKTFEIQPSAGEGPARQRQDRKLGEAIKAAVADDGVIDGAEMDNHIAPLFKDRGLIGKSEVGLVNLLDSARDGRRKASIDGMRVRLAPEAKRSFLHHRANLDAKIAAPAGLSEAGFGRAAVASTKTWYTRAVTAAHVDL